MSTEPAKVTTELSEVTALAQAQDLPRDLALIKMENDSIMALAAARPRNYAAVLADIKQQLATFKSFAQHAMYAKPVGRDEQNRMKYARGLSIRAAEAIAAAYGYNRSRVDVTPLDEDTARIEATFVDYQTGRIWQKAGVVSKNYKDRYGKVRRHSDDRFYNVVCEAEGSKRVRECILRSVPPGLRSELELCVNEQLDSFLDDSTTQKLVASFSAKGITAEHLERIVGKRLTSLDREDRQTLIGLWNALEQGESTVSELIGDEDRPNTDQVIADVTRPATRAATCTTKRNDDPRSAACHQAGPAIKRAGASRACRVAGRMAKARRGHARGTIR
ncbi:MAG: hypothetical protein AMJ84_13355 [Acidithiobacillales bacterium SM23_46]|nr:MAG: hypothetical protein AMJ84_13355 [Acidithiobacillales bacterium SM23_46]